MTDVAATIAAVRHARELLADCGDDPAATRVAQALDRWLKGEDLAEALDLPGDWRQRLRVGARDRALAELSRVHGDLDCSTLAERIVVGLSRAHAGRRRDGSLGLIDDLAAAGCSLSARRLRQLIGDIRRGQQTACDGHGYVST